MILNQAIEICKINPVSRMLSP